AYACDHPDFKLKLRVINTLAWHNLFCYNMFIRPNEHELKEFEPTFTIINIPAFLSNPSIDGTRAGNFTIVNFTKKIILIGGSGYAGEMKKGIFSVLNFLLPYKHKVLSMHCAANIGAQGDTAVFFGLSGTGKTTLSADPQRQLIGDDEHGWDKEVVF
ncbi:MAG: phosphoenolpyruvate carboxykinase (ATP), partial [Bacteroidota bacterium]|nr:phosphoenolpyruvate carboxykinase (ATP) [Bacteroidota bacterium]